MSPGPETWLWSEEATGLRVEVEFETALGHDEMEAKQLREVLHRSTRLAHPWSSRSSLVVSLIFG